MIEPTCNQEIEAAELTIRGLHTCAVCRLPNAPANQSVCDKCFPDKWQAEYVTTLKTCLEKSKQLCDTVTKSHQQVNDLAKRLQEENRVLQRRLQMALSAASNGWVQGWHSGNQHMALPPDMSDPVVMREWQESRTLKVIQRINSGAYDDE